VSYLEDTSVLQFYNGTAWANVSQIGDITAVTAGTALTGGGTSGDVTLDVNLAAVGSAVLASPNVTGTATIAAGSVTGNLVVSGTATLASGTVVGNLAVGGNLSDPNWTASRVLTTDGTSNAVTNSVTTTELSYLSGVTSAIQTQINGRVSQTNGVVTTAAVGSAVVRNVSISTAVPGTAVGMDGDVWLVYTP
jgi:trimeric autotransporter adhesin